MHFTPKNKQGHENYLKDIKEEENILNSKFEEIIKTKDIQKAQIFLSYKPLVIKNIYAKLRINILREFIIHKIHLKDFFDIFRINPEDLILKNDYKLFFLYVNLLIKEEYLFEARVMLNIARKNRWISVEYFYAEKSFKSFF